MNTVVQRHIDNTDFFAGIIEANGIQVGPSPQGLLDELNRSIDRRRTDPLSPEFRKAIRDMLRVGGFKPSGRNKPANEYLAACAAKGGFPIINNIVEINNLVSLETGLPISIVDLDRALMETDGLTIRLGGEKESYVFNPSGQEIDLTGLVCLARVSGEALANPVKDSMLSKTDETTAAVLAVIYGSRTTVTETEMQEANGLFSRLLEQYAGASEVHPTII